MTNTTLTEATRCKCCSKWMLAGATAVPDGSLTRGVPNMAHAECLAQFRASLDASAAAARKESAARVARLAAREGDWER